MAHQSNGQYLFYVFGRSSPARQILVPPGNLGEPLRLPEPEPQEGAEEEEGDEETPDKETSAKTTGNEETRGDVLDEITGQGRLF